MKNLFTTLILAALVLAVGCTGSKSFSNKAAKLDKSGLYAEASDMYLQSAVRNPKNTDAKIGLKKTGQQVLNDKLSVFFKNFSMGSNKEAAVNAYLDAVDLQDRERRAGVVLEIPDSYATDFEQVKTEYITDLYSQGHDLLDQKDYATAETVFAKINKLEPGYKDAGNLKDVAFMQPLYESGKAALAAGQYRKGYADLDRVVRTNAAYKDAAALKQECVEKGRYAIAVLPFNTAGTQQQSAQAATMQAYVTSALTNMNDPFISVVDRENIQKILDEQRLGMSGVVDEGTAVSAGKLMGAQAVIMGTVMDYKEALGKTRQSTRDGYESYQVKVLNTETNQYGYETRYKPVKYTEYYKQNQANISFSFKVVSLETGQVMFSNVVEKQAEDHANFATYDGNVKALYPKVNGLVGTSSSSRRGLTTLLEAPREVKSVSDLSNDLLRTTAQAAASAIQQQLAVKLP